MSKGVVVQLDYDTAHILKNDGSFVSCPRDMSWQIGDVVTLSQHPRISLKVILIACSITFCLLAGTGITLYQLPATYLEMSVNPSIQMTLNRFDRVLSVKGLNAEGDTLIQGVSYKNLSLDEAYARLLNRLDNNGYLTDATLQLVIANNSQKKIDNIEQNLRGIFEKYGQFNNLQISIKRYTNDEYLALEHPLPIKTIPAQSSQNPSEQKSEPPSLDAPSSSQNVESSIPPSETLPSQTEDMPSPSPSEAPSYQPENTPSTPPPNAPNSNNWHNGNWNNGDWRNGWYDWDCR